MLEKSLGRLQYLCEILPPLMENIDEQAFSFKPTPEKWSKKEILGHLIDSVTNNHHRFIRAQFEDVPKIGWEQDLWNKFGFYNQIDSKQLISLWAVYNKQLLELIKLMPKENLQREFITGFDQKFTVESFVDNYLEHLEHHLKQIVEYI
jgi:hypothetical protein